MSKPWELVSGQICIYLLRENRALPWENVKILYTWKLITDTTIQFLNFYLKFIFEILLVEGKKFIYYYF